MVLKQKVVPARSYFISRKRQGDDVEVRPGGLDMSLSAWGQQHGDRRIRLPTRQKSVNDLEALRWQSTHGMDARLVVLMQQDVGAIPSIVDHDIIRCQRRQMLCRTHAFIAMSDQIEVPWQVGVELIEAAQQPLRIVRGLRGQQIAVGPQLTRERELGAIDGKEPMAEPGLRSRGGVRPQGFSG